MTAYSTLHREKTIASSIETSPPLIKQSTYLLISVSETVFIFGKSELPDALFLSQKKYITDTVSSRHKNVC